MATRRDVREGVGAVTETDRLRALATEFRDAEDAVKEHGGSGAYQRALADLFDGIADRHALHASLCGDPDCSASAFCDSYDECWPCPDVRAALAVADALGVE